LLLLLSLLLEQQETTTTEEQEEVAVDFRFVVFVWSGCRGRGRGRPPSIVAATVAAAAAVLKKEWFVSSYFLSILVPGIAQSRKLNYS